MDTNQASSAFGAESKWSNPVSFQRKGIANQKAALTTGEFLKNSCDQMAIGVGPRTHADCPHRVTAECYSPDDNSSLEDVIAAAYRQIFGNAHHYWTVQIHCHAFGTVIICRHFNSFKQT